MGVGGGRDLSQAPMGVGRLQCCDRSAGGFCGAFSGIVDVTTTRSLAYASLGRQGSTCQEQVCGLRPLSPSYPAVVFSYLLLTEYLQLQSAANTQATHVLRPAPKRDDEAGAQEARVAIAFCLVESRWSPCTRALVGARHETTQRALWPAVTGQKEDRRDN